MKEHNEQAQPETQVPDEKGFAHIFLSHCKYKTIGAHLKRQRAMKTSAFSDQNQLEFFINLIIAN